MKNKKLGKQPIVGFEFVDISLVEAQAIAAAGKGNYSDVIETLLQKIPQLAQDKSLAFGLPSGDEPEELHRRGVCLSVNLAFKRNMVPWRLTYSGTRKLFVLIPAKVLRARVNRYSPRKRKVDYEAICSLRKERLKYKEIATRLGVTINTVRYALRASRSKQNGGNK